jgi:uncharacterized protein
MTRGFFHYQLRTTDVPSARAFYSSVLGHDKADIFPLHEQALARGARPHWLGHLQVAEVDVATADFVARGATPLGPKWTNPQGLEAAVVRDPGGAIVALSKPSAARFQAPEVAWHQLSTRDVPSAQAGYRELMGWDFRPPFDVGPLRVHPFAQHDGGAVVGGISDIAGRPEVHPHWLFHFRVASLEPALAAVRRAGGLVLAPITLPTGVSMAACDDPQGAAFALLEGPA